MAKDKYNVFLSYSFKDKPWVAEFSSALREAGIQYWFDVADLLPGDRWRDEIQVALRQSTILIVILSRNSTENPWTFFELGAAVADKKKIIPVLTEDVELKRLGPLLSQFQFLKESSPKEAGRLVAQAIEKRQQQDI
jgi:hypothetical protein